MKNVINRYSGLTAFLSVAIALPLCGCGESDGIQSNPYAAPTEPAVEAESVGEAGAEADAGASLTTEAAPAGSSSKSP